MHTNSVNRSYSDLSQRHFLFYAFLLCAARTIAQQPLNIALARKQTSSHSNNLTTKQLLLKLFKQEGQWRALMRGMPALTLGCALSEVVYLGLFEFGRERLSLLSSTSFNNSTDNTSNISKTDLDENTSPSLSRDAITSYCADALCRVVYIPFSIIAFRQMTWRSNSFKSATRRHKKSNSHIIRKSNSSAHHGTSKQYKQWCEEANTNHTFNMNKRYQSNNSSIITKSSMKSKPLNMFRTCKVMYNEKGFRTLFAGYGSTLLVGCQWTALWWGLYGSCKALLYNCAAPLLLNDEQSNKSNQ